MQDVLDGVSLRADEAQVLGRLSRVEQGFIRYLQQKFQKETAAQVMSVIIQLGLGHHEQQFLPDRKPVFIEDVEDVVRVLYARSGIPYLPAERSVDKLLARMPKTRGVRYEDLGEIGRSLVDGVIPSVFGWNADPRVPSMEVFDQLTTRVFYLIQLGAEVGPHTDWIVDQLDDRSRRVLDLAVLNNGYLRDRLLAQLVLETLPVGQRKEFYAQLPFPAEELPGQIQVLTKFIREYGRPAQLSSPVTDKKPVGGIDLNAGLLDLQIRRDGRGVPLPLPQQPIESMHIDGFIPVILNITPVPSLPLLLGLVTGEGGADTAGARGTAPADQRGPADRRDLISREPETLSLVR